MALIDMSGTLADFVSDTLTITRADGPGTYVGGIFVPAATSEVQVAALVVPLLGGPQLMRLPEGLRSTDAIEVFSVAPLRVDAPGQRPDVIAYNGHTWQVDVVDDWGGAGGFYHALATKVEPGEALGGGGV